MEKVFYNKRLSDAKALEKKSFYPLWRKGEDNSLQLIGYASYNSLGLSNVVGEQWEGTTTLPSSNDLMWNSSRLWQRYHKKAKR